MQKKIFNVVITLILLLFIGLQFKGTKELNTTRGHLDTAREQLIRAEEYNRELTERLGSISSNVQQLEELADRNVSGVRECIEIIEEQRVIIKEMEDSLFGGDTLDSYYDYCDSRFDLK